MLFKPTTLFIDDFLDAPALSASGAGGGFSCSVSAPPTGAGGGARFDAASSSVLLPGEGEALGQRGRVALRATLALGEAADALIEELRLAAHVLLGTATLATSPSCTAAASNRAPVFKPRGFVVGEPDEAGLRVLTVQLAPAGMLNAFAGGTYRHIVDPDVKSALAARNETLATYGYDSPHGRSLFEVPLGTFNLNFDTATRAAVEPVIPLYNVTFDAQAGIALDYGASGSYALDCKNCFFYFTHKVDVSFTMCFWDMNKIDFGFLGDAYIGKSPVGAGCTATDWSSYNYYDADDAPYGSHGGLRVALGATYSAQLAVGVGADFEMDLTVMGTRKAIPLGEKDKDGKPVAKTKLDRIFGYRPIGQPVTVSLCGLPLTIQFGAGVDFSADFNGRLSANFHASKFLEANFSAGFGYDSTLSPPFSTFKSSSTRSGGTPTTMGLSLDSASVRFGMIP